MQCCFSGVQHTSKFRYVCFPEVSLAGDMSNKYSFDVAVPQFVQIGIRSRGSTFYVLEQEYTSIWGLHKVDRSQGPSEIFVFQNDIRKRATLRTSKSSDKARNHDASAASRGGWDEIGSSSLISRQLVGLFFHQFPITPFK